MARNPNCIFCDQPFGTEESRKRSKEHAGPRWCAKLLPSIGSAALTHTVINPSGSTEMDHGNRDPFTVVCSDVCAGCNNGWMHELEESVGWMLGPMIQGEPRNLRYWRQVLAATWAMKTVMVWDSVVERNHYIPRVALHSFHQHQRLSLRQQVWVGRYTGNQIHQSFRETASHNIIGSDPVWPNRQEADAYVAAMTVGQLAFLAFGHVMDTAFRVDPPAALDSKVLEIWPPSREVAEWPPGQALTDNDLEKFVYSVGEPMADPLA